MELFFWTSLWCLATMLPVNLTDNYIDTLMIVPDNSTDTSTYSFTEFDKLGLANITPGSPRMWVHLVSVYVVSCFTLWVGAGRVSVFIKGRDLIHRNHSVLLVFPWPWLALFGLGCRMLSLRRPLPT